MHACQWIPCMPMQHHGPAALQHARTLTRSFLEVQLARQPANSGKAMGRCRVEGSRTW